MTPDMILSIEPDMLAMMIRVRQEAIDEQQAQDTEARLSAQMAQSHRAV